MPTNQKDIFLLDLSKRLDSIDLKLNNHMEHMAGDLSAMRTDIAWLKEYITKHVSSDSRESVTEIKTQTDVAWIKRFFWIATTGVVASLVADLMAFVFKK
jgi:hypothetical protein